MKKCKTKNNRIAILVCAVSIMTVLGMMTGCSVQEPVPSETQTGTSLPGQDANEQFEKLSGTWIIDFERTDPSLWGTGISAGNQMEISPAGEFAYFIGIGVGGTGQCVEQNGEITVEIQPYEEHSSEKEILALKYENDEGEERILMNWHGEDVCWKRGTNPSAENSSLESDNIQTPEDILPPDAQAVREIVEKFTLAYFSGDKETIKDCLTNSYDWDIEVYTGKPAISNYTIKGLEADIDEMDIGSSKVVSVEFKYNEKDDTVNDLTLELMKEKDGWKIQFYGIEQ